VENGKRVQRVRIGLTGLAFVFLLVLLGAVFTSPSNEEPITPNSIETQLSGGNQAAAAVNEAHRRNPSPSSESRRAMPTTIMAPSPLLRPRRAEGLGLADGGNQSLAAPPQGANHILIHNPN